MADLWRTAARRGMRLFEPSNDAHRRKLGARFLVYARGSNTVVFAADDERDVRDWLRKFRGATAGEWKNFRTIAP